MNDYKKSLGKLAGFPRNDKAAGDHVGITGFPGAQHQRVGIVGFQHAGAIEDFIPDFPHGEPVYGCAGNFHGCNLWPVAPTLRPPITPLSAYCQTKRQIHLAADSFSSCVNGSVGSAKVRRSKIINSTSAWVCYSPSAAQAPAQIPPQAWMQQQVSWRVPQRPVQSTSPPASAVNSSSRAWSILNSHATIFCVMLCAIVTSSPQRFSFQDLRGLAGIKSRSAFMVARLSGHAPAAIAFS